MNNVDVRQAHKVPRKFIREVTCQIDTSSCERISARVPFSREEIKHAMEIEFVDFLRGQRKLPPSNLRQGIDSRFWKNKWQRKSGVAYISWTKCGFRTSDIDILTPTLEFFLDPEFGKREEEEKSLRRHFSFLSWILRRVPFQNTTKGI